MLSGLGTLPLLHDPRALMVSKLLLGIGVVAAADWLLLGSWPGISLVLFFGLIAIVAVIANPIRATAKQCFAAWGVFLTAQVPFVEQASFTAFLFALLGTTGFVVFMLSGADLRTLAQARRIILLPFYGIPWLIRDILRAKRAAARRTRASVTAASLVPWIVPGVLFVVFVSLLSAANPLIEAIIHGADPTPLLALLDPWRIAFWLLILAACWPAIHFHTIQSRPLPATVGSLPPKTEADLDLLFGRRSIVWSLVLFNLLFLIQTSMDGAYLWGGVALPDGMSYAAYAHRGAYPLIVTAILAGAFVLIAMRRGGPAETSRLIRPLVLIWIGQNIGLVISSMLRLDLYVAAYSLTDWRVDAFIWMVLVLIGLILIVVQIALRKTNMWLIGGNAAALAGVLYVSCLIDFPYVEASYNVTHSREVSGQGLELDISYLWEEGPAAIAALDLIPPDSPVWKQAAKQLSGRMTCWQDHPIGWRAWGFRSWRLNRYLNQDSRTIAAFRNGL